MPTASKAILDTVRTLVIDRATAEVTSALARVGLRAVLLKGPSIANWLYPAGRGRLYVDSDLLVSPGSLARAEGILTSLGFIDLFANAGRDERDAHGSPWRRFSDNVCIDLHRTLPGVQMPAEETWTILGGNLDRMAVGGAEVAILNVPARLLHVALHAAHNGVANRQSLQDLLRAIDQLPLGAWRQAADLARSLNAVASFAAGLRLVRSGKLLADRLGLPQSESVEIQLRAMSARGPALGFETLREKRGTAEKAAFLLRNLAPSPTFMRMWLPLARRGPIGLLVSYGWRWLWLASRVVPAYLMWRRASRAAGKLSSDPRYPLGEPARRSNQTTEAKSAGERPRIG